ncbi:MAG TPA: hypothetical protein VK979_03950 [Guyparkeria sp.]|nr:hypothetical protein [Guyparkeria sp.]
MEAVAIGMRRVTTEIIDVDPVDAEGRPAVEGAGAVGDWIACVSCINVGKKGAMISWLVEVRSKGVNEDSCASKVTLPLLLT